MVQLFPISNNIAQNLQQESNGGLIAFLIRNQLQNESSASFTEHFSTVILEEGFLIAIIIFSLIALSVVIFLIYFIVMFAKKRNSQMYDRIRFWSHDHKCLVNAEKVLFILATVATFIFLVLGLVAVDSYKRSMTTSKENNTKSSDSQPDSFIDGISKSLEYTKNYLETISQSTDAIIQKVLPVILQEIETMQQKNSQSLSNELNKKLGVASVLEGAQSLLKHISTLFTNVTSLSNHEKRFFITVNKIEEQLDEILIEMTLLKRTEMKDCSEGTVCDDRYVALRKELRTTINSPNILDNALDFVSSFEFIMRQQNKSLDIIKADIEKGNKESEVANKRVNERLKKEMSLDTMFYNMSQQFLSKIDEYLLFPIDLLTNQTNLLKSDGPKIISQYILPITALFMVCFLLILLFLALSFCYKHWLKSINYDLSSFFFIGFFLQILVLILVLGVTTTAILVGGYLQTNVCRYTDPQQSYNGTNVTGSFYLDSQINDLIDNIIQDAMSSMNITVNSPLIQNVLYGLLIKCKDNSGILEALDLNFDAICCDSDPTGGLMDIGKSILLDEIGSLNSTKLMPEYVIQNLIQAGELDIFSKLNYDAKYELVNSASVKSWITTVVADIRSFLKFAKISGSGLDKMNFHLNMLNYHTIDSENYLTKVKADMQHIQALRPIKPLIAELLRHIRAMIANIDNKDYLIYTASHAYDRMIIENNKDFSLQLISKVKLTLKSSLGKCRPLYEAFVSGNNALCHTAGKPINTIWFILCCTLMFFIPITIRIASYFIHHIIKKTTETSYEMNTRPKSSSRGMYKETNFVWVTAKHVKDYKKDEENV